MFRGLLSLALLGVIGFGFLSWWGSTHTTQTVIDTVVRTEKVVSSDGLESRYMIFGKSETYQNADNFWNQKNNSAEIYRTIITGATYELTVSGYRIPLLGLYRNITKAKLVSGVQ